MILKLVSSTARHIITPNDLQTQHLPCDPCSVKLYPLYVFPKHMPFHPLLQSQPICQSWAPDGSKIQNLRKNIFFFSHIHSK